MSDKRSIFDVAHFFTRKVKRGSGSIMTPLRLQKLVYYTQAWSLAILDEMLFSDKFEAWIHGPV